MDMKFRTDVQRWLKKSERVRNAMLIETKKSTKVVSKALYTRVQRNLKGPHYPPPKYSGPRTGEMPVPRVTGTLARSLRIRKIFDSLWKVFSDGQIASYNIWVHNGTRRTRPRRFIGDIVTTNRDAWLKYIKTRVTKAVREVGSKK